METVNNPRLPESYLRQYGISDLFVTFKPRFYLLHYFPGELLTSPFSPSRYFQFIVDGRLLLYEMRDESSVNPIVTAYNQIFALGDIEFLDTGFTPLSAEAKTDVFSAAIYLEQCKDALLNELKFLRCLCIGFAQKLQSAITDSNRSSLRERVAHFLRLAEPGQPITDIARIAKSLNVSNRHLLRILKEYCNAGVLEHEKKGVYRLVHKP